MPKKAMEKHPLLLNHWAIFLDKKKVSMFVPNKVQFDFVKSMAMVSNTRSEDHILFLSYPKLVAFT